MYWGRRPTSFGCQQEASLFSKLVYYKSDFAAFSGRLQVDMHMRCELLDWKPSVAVDEYLRSAVM